jgi:hypothetical protein
VGGIGGMFGLSKLKGASGGPRSDTQDTNLLIAQSTVPLVRERMADILTRKRSFVHLDEYLTRHPDFANAVRDRPCK